MTTSMTICSRFRPLSSKERRDRGDTVCIQCIDSETFLFKDEKDEEFTFSFDKVFYENSEQAQVYEFLAWPIVQDAVDGINGTIITYGQTGAGKTYSMEGPSIMVSDEQKRGLLPRVVEGLFGCIKSSGGTIKHQIKLSMVEIYMEKVRDLFDLAKDNIQIKESKSQGILLSGVTEISVLDPAEALLSLSSGIANRAVGETQMNMASSRSHCIYIFTVQQEVKKDGRLKTSKLILVDLAGSEKVEKTGAEGKVLEESKTINKSLSVLGNVINALTSGSPGKTNHIPFHDSKLTRILQDSLGGNSRTALLCCCSPSPSNALESLSTLRFGMRVNSVLKPWQGKFGLGPCSTHGTTVVAMFVKSGILFGADSRETQEPQKGDIRIVKDNSEKIKTLTGGITVAYAGDVDLWISACKFINEWVTGKKGDMKALADALYKSLKTIDLGRHNQGLDLIFAKYEEVCPCLYAISMDHPKEDVKEVPKKEESGRQEVLGNIPKGVSQITPIDSGGQGIVGIGGGGFMAKHYIESRFLRKKRNFKLFEATSIVRNAIKQSALNDECTGGKIQMFHMNASKTDSVGSPETVLEAYIKDLGQNDQDEERSLIVVHPKKFRDATPCQITNHFISYSDCDALVFSHVIYFGKAHDVHRMIFCSQEAASTVLKNVPKLNVKNQIKGMECTKVSQGVEVYVGFPTKDVLREVLATVKC